MSKHKIAGPTTGEASPDPLVEQILEFNAGRKPRGLAFKYQRMAVDAFAFFRGTLDLFARGWQQYKPADLGPELLSCGDLHIENFGAYETDEGTFCYDVNDFDEALLAPAAFDLVRVSTSILLAAAVWQLDHERAERTARMLLDNYRQVLAAGAGVAGQAASDGLTLQHGAGPLWELLAKTAVNTQADMLDHHTKVEAGNRRRIVRSDDKHPPLSDDRVENVTAAVEAYGRQHNAASAFKVLDVTGRIAGVGSLGVRRALVLVEGEGSPDGNKLLDVKEALPSAAVRWVGRALPHEPNEAARIVDAQRQLQAHPTAGLDVLPIGPRWYRMRAMVPDENRSKLDRLRCDEPQLHAALAAIGQLVGRAHLRGAAWCQTQHELARLAAPAALDSILPAARHAAERALADYEHYRQAYERGLFQVDPS